MAAARRERLLCAVGWRDLGRGGNRTIYLWGNSTQASFWLDGIRDATRRHGGIAALTACDATAQPPFEDLECPCVVAFIEARTVDSALAAIHISGATSSGWATIARV